MKQKLVSRLKISLADVEGFRNAIGVINHICIEAAFKIDREKIEVVQMDPANVCMVIWKYLSSACIEWDVGESQTILLNVDNLYNILKNAKKSDVLALETDETNNVILTLQGDSVRKYTIPILINEEKEQKVPELEFKAKVVMPSKKFYEQVKEVESVYESVAFSVRNKRFSLIVHGDMNNMEINNQEDDFISVLADAPQETKYSTEYLKKFVDSKKIAGDVVIEMRTQYPLRLTYTVLDKQQIQFILAPRAECE